MKIDGRHIGEISALSILGARDWFRALDGKLDAKRTEIAGRILKEINDRLGFLVNVGLEYLTLSRHSGTLSGGESQRIRLASQIGSGLTGVLYVLDEPSIGLHQRDNARFCCKHWWSCAISAIPLSSSSMTREAIRAADYVIDMGPAAGQHGGEVVATGTAAEIMAQPASLTGQYLVGLRQIPLPKQRRKGHARQTLTVRGARANNLDNVDATIPLGAFVCVTGVSGSGKSTLIIETLYKALARFLNGARDAPGGFETIEGLHHLDKVIDIDQSPIGRTPRSNPATYTGAFTPIRDWFAGLPEASLRGYKPGRFSFNVKGGRCEACKGDGLIKIEMHFLPDVYVTCDVCQGRRYNRETLEIAFRGKSIADVLDMTVDEGAEFFRAVPTVRDKLVTLQRVGLGYIHVGQQATTLSGGEAQRGENWPRSCRSGPPGAPSIFSTSRRPACISRTCANCWKCCKALVESGNTVVVIEHNLEVIKTADWDPRPRPRGRRRRRPDRRRGHAGGGGRRAREPHRWLPGGDPRAPGAGRGQGRENAQTGQWRRHEGQIDPQSPGPGSPRSGGEARSGAAG